MSIKIKDLPQAERPYEKLELYGEKNLSNAELLAIIIKNGTKEETSVQLAQRILKLRQTKEGNLSFLRDLSIEEFMKIKGIGKVKAIQLKAICELSIRMSKPDNYKGIKIKEPEEVAQMLLNEFKNENHEIARVILLDKIKRIIKVEDVALGGTNFVDIGIKNIISCSVKTGASKVILIHNHPSGNSKPSIGDIKFTDKLYNALSIFEIDLYDHFVIGGGEYTSVYKFVEKLKDKNQYLQK